MKHKMRFVLKAIAFICTILFIGVVSAPPASAGETYLDASGKNYNRYNPLHFSFDVSKKGVIKPCVNRCFKTSLSFNKVRHWQKPVRLEAGVMLSFSVKF